MLDKLLPKGFQDSLFKESFLENTIVQSCVNNFISYGYKLINPPLIEFEDSLISGIGKSFKDNTFRFPDSLSNKMLAIRPDITWQIVRIVKHLLSKEVLPMRLLYFGDVLHTNKQSLNSKRQLMQVGIELVGSDTYYADSEVIWVSLNTIENLGIDQSAICIDFSLPQLTFILLEEYSFSEADKKDMLYALSKKDFDIIEKLDKKYLTSFIFSILSQNDLDLKEIKDIPVSENTSLVMKRLFDVYEILKNRNIQCNIIFDLLEVKNLHYNYGIGFSIFSIDRKLELARGGRYKIDDNSEYKEIKGVGVTLYISELLKLSNYSQLSNSRKKIYVPIDSYNSDLLESFKSKGYNIINSLSKDEDAMLSAKTQNCDYCLEDGKLVSLD